MADSELDRRLYEAFLRGYQEFAATGGDLGVAGVPYGFLIDAASWESKELRRSIDACRSALAQIDALPTDEQDQLKTEARASLEALQDLADRLLARLHNLKPSSETGTTASQAPPPAKTRAPAKRSKRPSSRR